MSISHLPLSLIKNQLSFIKDIIMNRLFLFLFLCVLFSVNAQKHITLNEAKAFPTAMGWGRFAGVGQAQRMVYIVDNLNDSGAGSLRDALSQGNRDIIFNLSGTITLESGISIPHSNIRILGQTAFRNNGHGITIKGDGSFGSILFYFTGNHIVVRHLRFRRGEGVVGEVSGDNLNFTGNNWIVDHCSISWSTDENISGQGKSDGSSGLGTVQNCIIAEGLYLSTHAYSSNPNHSVYQKGHSKGSLFKNEYPLIGGYSWVRNIFAHNDGRNPKLNFANEEHEVINNLNYNIAYFNRELGSSDSSTANTKFNVINNLSIAGKDSRNHRFSIYSDINTSLYVEGNRNYQVASASDNQWDAVGNIKTSNNLTTANRLFNPLNTPMLNEKIISADSLETKLLGSVGASLFIDLVDTRLFNDIITRGPIIEKTIILDNKNFRYYGLKNSTVEAGGYPVLSPFQNPIVDNDNNYIDDGYVSDYIINNVAGYGDRDLYFAELAGDFEKLKETIFYVEKENELIPTTVSAITKSNQDKGDYEIQNGNTLKLIGNTWKKVDFQYTITANTIMSFDFKIAGNGLGEIHAIGFDDTNPNDLPANHHFHLAGNEGVSWGSHQFEPQYIGSDWISYSIPVGEKIPHGVHEYLTFIADADSNSTVQESYFRNVRFSETSFEIVMNVEGEKQYGELSSLEVNNQDKGNFKIQTRDTLKLIGSAWKKAKFNYTVTPNTVIKFDFKIPAGGLGEIHAIGFHDGTDLTAIDKPKHFQLAGTENMGLQIFNGNYSGSDWQSYAIPVGHFFTGSHEYLTFIADADSSSLNQESYFRNIRFSETSSEIGNLLIENAQGEGRYGFLSSFEGANQDNGTFETQDNDTLKLIGNAWKKAKFNYTVTPNTVIKFDFKIPAGGLGDIHAIGFHDGTDLTVIGKPKHFQLAGPQIMGTQNFNGNYLGSDWQSYTIPVGQFFTGSHEYLTFIADADSSLLNQESYFRNIQFSEGAVNLKTKITFINTDENIAVYPNPFQDKITISGIEGEKVITVADLSGRIVYETTSIEESPVVTMKTYPSGVYFVEVKNTTEGNTFKVIKE